jgi:hypothetical protein
MSAEAVSLFTSIIDTPDIPVPVLTDVLDVACETFGFAGDFLSVQLVLQCMADHCISPSPKAVAAVVRAAASCGQINLVSEMQRYQLHHPPTSLHAISVRINHASPIPLSLSRALSLCCHNYYWDHHHHHHHHHDLSLIPCFSFLSLSDLSALLCR